MDLHEKSTDPSEWKIIPPRTFDLRVFVSAQLPEDLGEWPNEMFDQLMAAMERKDTEIKDTLKLISTRCDYDYEAEKWFVHIVCMTDPKITFKGEVIQP